MWRGRELGGGKAQSSEAVMEYEPACGVGVSPREPRWEGILFVFYIR